MQTWNKQKTCTTNFANIKRKKGVTTQGKTQSKARNTFQMNAMQEQTSMRTNVHQRTLQARSKPGRRCRQEFCESETPEENFLNKKMLNFWLVRFFKWKINGGVFVVWIRPFWSTCPEWDIRDRYVNPYIVEKLWLRRLHSDHAGHLKLRLSLYFFHYKKSGTL